MAACGSNKSKVEEIQLEIPVALVDNADAMELIEDMTDAVNSTRKNMAEGAKFAIEHEKNGSDSLTFRQGVKGGIFAMKMMLSARKIEKIREKVKQLKPELNEPEWTALEVKINELEARVGDLNPEDLGLTEEEIAKLKAEEELRFGEDENAIEEELDATQEETENAMALREMEQELMQSANPNNEMQQSESNDEGGIGWLGILFPILVFGLIIFGVTRSIKTYKRRFKNVSNSFFQVKNQFNNKK